MANKKRNLSRLHRQIYTHTLRTTPIYAEMVNAPDHVIQGFLDDFSNPLDRKYAAGRIADARMDVAITRLEQLDPAPWEHQHPNCMMNGLRSERATGSDNEVFAPRDGFLVDPEAYRD